MGFGSGRDRDLPIRHPMVGKLPGRTRVSGPRHAVNRPESYTSQAWSSWAVSRSQVGAKPADLERCSTELVAWRFSCLRVTGTPMQ